ncbi:hypothetical protein L950_0200565 [Sphingobacterium sp. IITKGP-BTPF85]|nr:hypothetical protein L950_0200565 [Sphingobacterium sp. IITKGP-BTPF85]
MYRFISFLAGLQNQFINFLRFAVFLVMAWIGGLKAFQYEADGIVPFVANSPVMSFFTARRHQSISSIKILKVKLFKKMWIGIMKIGHIYFLMAWEQLLSELDFLFYWVYGFRK